MINALPDLAAEVLREPGVERLYELGRSVRAAQRFLASCSDTEPASLCAEVDEVIDAGLRTARDLLALDPEVMLRWVDALARQLTLHKELVKYMLAIGMREDARMLEGAGPGLWAVRPAVMPWLSAEESRELERQLAEAMGAREKAAMTREPGWTDVAELARMRATLDGAGLNVPGSFRSISNLRAERTAAQIRDAVTESTGIVVLISPLYSGQRTVARAITSQLKFHGHAARMINTVGEAFGQAHEALARHAGVLVILNVDASTSPTRRALAQGAIEAGRPSLAAVFIPPFRQIRRAWALDRARTLSRDALPQMWHDIAALSTARLTSERFARAVILGDDATTRPESAKPRAVS